MKNNTVRAFCALASLLPLPVFAVTDTWGGFGTDNNISTNNNWSDNTAPVSDLLNTDLIFVASQFLPRISPNFSVPFSADSLTFAYSTDATAFNFSGSALTIGMTGIANNEDSTHTFANTVAVGTATSTFAAGFGPLAFTGPVNLGTSALSVTGASNTSFRNFAGTGSVTKSGTGATTWAPTTATSADIIVNAGMLSIAADGSADILDGSASIAVNGTSILNINEDMVLDGGAQLTRQGAGTVALASYKSLTVQGGSDFIVTGDYAPSGLQTFITVTGGGSTMQTTSGGNLGVFSYGRLNVLSGGSVSAGGGLVVVDIGGNVEVDGSGSSLSAGNTSELGRNSSLGSVTFSNGATGSFATVIVGGRLEIIEVLTGADVTTSGDLQLSNTGGAGNSSVTLTVNGAGSTWTQTGATATILGVASGGREFLDVQNGGVFTSGTGNVTLNPTASINIDGGTVNLAGPLVRNGGALNFTSGALRIRDNFTVGVGGLLGTNLILDATRLFTTSATTTIDAFRTLTLNGGGFSTGTLVNNGTLAFNSGTLGVTGGGGLNIGSGPLGSSLTLATSRTLQVTNTTTIESGALLRVDGGTFSGADITNRGTIDHVDGTFTVSATGTLTNEAAGRLFVGGRATPAGTIENAGRITLQGSIGFLGGVGAIRNTGLITGDGTIAKPVTNAATGQMRAEAGRTLIFTGTFAPNAGTFSLEGGTLEFTTAITNSATGSISGRGTLYTGGLTNNGQIAFFGGTADLHGDVSLTAGSRVATTGAGSLTTFFDDVIHNGMEIFTGAGASTAFFGAQTGAGNFTGTGTVYFNGELRPGNSPAEVRYGGDLVLGGASSLTMEIGGLVAGSEHDRLIVAGTLFEDGVLAVVLYNGFLPQFGNSFDLFDTARVVGGFDAIILPTLAGDLTWDASNLQSSGQLSVVPEPGAPLLALLGASLLAVRRRHFHV